MTDEVTHRRVADAYAATYDWPVTIHDAAIDGPDWLPPPARHPITSAG